ncbi:hypothetical protein KIW84_014875 [Lathyrus oleraceus]|uniref:Uncharacterized protein n=1 Tax=Pisum sativum TaxID=3888 RepID=A0A9D5BP80_PEA|nr:hypothetical protein KIW84_014875 [Pisum sativum]
MSMKMKMEEQENLNLIPPTATLEIDKDLTLLPRIKLNLTVHPSTPSSSITNQIDEWKTKRALLDFLQTSHSLPFPLPEEDLQFKRFNKDLKKRKREDPVVYGTLHIWDLSFLSEKNENDVVKWRNGLVEKLNGVELNLQGVRFRLEVDVPECDDFDGMKKNWEEFYAFRNVNRSSKREPDTVVVSGVPSRWFAETRVSSKPSMLVTHTIFSKFGKIRTNVLPLYLTFKLMPKGLASHGDKYCKPNALVWFHLACCRLWGIVAAGIIHVMMSFKWLDALEVWLGPCKFGMKLGHVCCRFIGCLRFATISLLQVDLMFINGEWLYAALKHQSVANSCVHDML